MLAHTFPNYHPSVNYIKYSIRWEIIFFSEFVVYLLKSRILTRSYIYILNYTEYSNHKKKLGFRAQS